ncbi:MAG: flavin-nucleotide-binding protein [Polaromonas sp.]|nr:flavin-nucleotide-binding protein [Polaromonas sp.]
MLTAGVLKYIESSVLCWLATVDEHGAPNVSPKEIFVSYGNDTVLVANIASPNTIRNLRFNPKVCLGFVEVFVQKGFKLSGTARVVGPRDSDFPVFLAPLEAMTQGKFPIHSVIAVRVERVAPIVAPGYRQFPGTTEASQIEAALKTYKVTRGDGNA